MLKEHSRKMHLVKDTRARLNRGKKKLERLKQAVADTRSGIICYDYPSESLRWYRDLTTLESSSWSLSEELVRAPGAGTEVDISEKDIVLVGLWVVNRAALWLSWQDSKPLLKFVENLDPHVFVL